MSIDHHRASEGYSTLETGEHDKDPFNREFLSIMASFQQHSGSN